MAYYLSPIGNNQIVDANGAPLSGGKIYAYLAGTSTPVATYADNAGTAQTSPIVLNSAGRPTLGPIWLLGGQAVKLVVQNSLGVQQYVYDNVTGVNDPSNASTADQWVAYTGTATYISATSFSVQGDQTNLFQVGRRTKTTNTGGTVYSTITASSYSPGTGLTTITVQNSSGSLDSGLSAVSYGLLSVTGSSVPANVLLQGGTAVASTSGTSIDFTGIPTWAKRVTLSFANLSTSGTSIPIVQIGDSGGIETTGYLSFATAPVASATITTASSTIGFIVDPSWSSTGPAHGAVVLTLIDSATNLWAATTIGGNTAAGSHGFCGGGSKSTSATLDRVRLTTTNGTDTFDAGTVNILYE